MKRFFVFTVLFLFTGCISLGNDKIMENSTLTTTPTTSTTYSTTSTTTSTNTSTTTSTTSTTLPNTSTTYSTATSSTTSTTVPLPFVDVYVQTNNKFYHPKQTMEITVDVFSERNIGGAELRVYGLEKLGYYFFDRKKPVNLNIGLNRFELEYIIPSCSACSGLDTGAYDINAEIEYVKKVIGGDNTSVEIR